MRVMRMRWVVLMVMRVRMMRVRVRVLRARVVWVEVMG